MSLPLPDAYRQFAGDDTEPVPAKPSLRILSPCGSYCAAGSLASRWIRGLQTGRSTSLKTTFCTSLFQHTFHHHRFSARLIRLAVRTCSPLPEAGAAIMVSSGFHFIKPAKRARPSFFSAFVQLHRSSYRLPFHPAPDAGILVPMDFPALIVPP